MGLHYGDRPLVFGAGDGLKFGRKGQIAAITCELYLLTLSAYATVSVSTGTRGREFQVLADGYQCYGAKIKPRFTEAHTLRLYRVSDQALLASKAFNATTAVEIEVLFDTPVDVVTGESYRIATDSASRGYYRKAGADHPDGSVVVLTGNVYCYAAADNVYPGSVLNTVSCAIEPKVCGPVARSVIVASPARYQTFQRDGSDQADIPISGTYTGTPAAIEASFNGGAYVTIDAAPAGGTFSGTLTNQAAGQGTLTVRFTDDTSKSATVGYVGIGDVFVCAGQSNMGGRGTNYQSYSHATLRATMLGNDYRWQAVSDPTDWNHRQVDTVSSDAAATGSWLPLLATSIMATTGFPVAFVPCAVGSSAITSWLPGANHSNRATLYGSMNYRTTQTGGARAVLWWQGEQDAYNGMAEATYNGHLDTVANAVNADQGIKLMPCKLQTCVGYDTSTVNAAIATAWGDNANVLTGPDFSDLTPVGDGVHFASDAELATVAARWDAAIDAAFWP